MTKICWQITVAAFMQPLQYDLRSPAAKDNSITHAAKAGSNTCNPIYIAGTILQLQSAMEFHRQLIHQQHLQSHLHCGKDPTVANHNGIPSTTHPAAPLAIPFALREGSYSCKSQWNSIGNSSSSTTCDPIYIAGKILQLQITMEFCRPHTHEKQLKPHLQCGTDPRPIRDRSEDDPPMIRPHTRPSRTRRTAEVDHRGSGTDFVWKNIGFRASAISQKRISCETSSKTPSATHPPATLAIPFTLREGSYSCKSQWNSIGNSSSSTTCDPIYIAGKILQLQITMEFCRPHTHEKQLKPHLQCGTDPRPIRDRSEDDPPMIRPHTRPSRTRRTAEVDHRGSGTDFVWKNIGFRASAISQKRISCETSSKTPSATPPPAPLAMPFTVREQSYCFFN